MKKVLACALALAVLLACGSALAERSKRFDDLSWWGRGGTPEPVQDPVRSGYWWWPTVPDSNVGDSELWGNRGVVYYTGYQPVIETPPPPPPPPPPVEEPKVIREVPVLNHILFDFDKSILKPEGQVEASKVVQFMNEWSDTTVIIEGHTCDIGTDQYNMGLGQRRADSVQKYLIDNGIAAGRVTTRSYGESSPAVPNTSRANRQLNRRAVFVFPEGL